MAFGIAYIHSFLAIITWASFGHLITLNDDWPGGWNNPKKSKSFWRSSLVAMVLKFVVLILIMNLIWKYPVVSSYGV